MTPAGLRQVPGHRTSSGSMMSATELSCCLKKVTLWLLTPLRSASYSNSLSPPASSPSLEPEVSKLLLSLSDTCSGLRWAREGKAHSGSTRDCPQPRRSLKGRNLLSGFPPLEAPSLCSYTSGDRESSLALSVAWAAHGWPVLPGRHASSSQMKSLHVISSH